MQITLNAVLATIGLAASIIIAPLHVSALPTRTTTDKMMMVKIIVPRNCGSGQPTASHLASPLPVPSSSSLPSSSPSVSPSSTSSSPSLSPTTTNNNNNGDTSNLLLPGNSANPPEPYFPPAAPEACPEVGKQLCGWFYPAGASRMECQVDGAYHILGTCELGNICQMDAAGKAVCVPE